MDIEKYIDSDLLDRFEFYNYGHALEILHDAFPVEWDELQECLRKLKLTLADIKKAGGNESPIPKKFDDVLYPYGWREIRISGDLIVKKYPRQTAQRRGRFADEPYEVETIEGYIDGHNIDFLKNRVAFDLEWNSKDQTFDRDLLAMRTYFDCGLIDVGVIVTRAEALNDIFKQEKNVLKNMADLESTIQNLQKFTNGKKYNTIYADPPWQFQNRTGKVAPEHKRLTRYETMTIEDIKALPIADITGDKAHLYLWVPNALLPDGLAVMDAWGFEYKGNLVWEKVRKDGGPDGRGVGFYFRNVTELILFGIKKKSAPNRTLQPARSQVNIIRAMKREHSRKPDEIIPIIEACSQGPRIELFARGVREGWDMWGNQATEDYEPTWDTYANHTVAPVK